MRTRVSAAIGNSLLFVLTLLLSMGTVRAWPPCPTISGGVQLLDPGLTLTVIRETDVDASPGYCSPQAAPWECMSTEGPQVLKDGAPGGWAIGVDGAGNHYNISGRTSADFDGATRGFYLQRIDPGGAVVNLAKLFTTITYPPTIYTDQFQYGSQFQLDVTNGKILFTAYHTLNYASAGCPTPTTTYGLVELAGLPRLFDTFVTFLPSGSALSIVAPALPDGFRSADALQVWTGNVRSMPDWSQAQPMACPAVLSPVPGQVVGVADSLPNPIVGQGRYYLVASQSGAARRLGRQYVNGAFSAREPAGLPACQ